jgi:propanediol dehydratase large subunit
MWCDIKEGTQMAATKEHAHELIERLAPKQLTAVVGLLEAMLDPVARALANAPVDDEPESELESAKVRESKDWLKQSGKVVSHEEVLSDFGLTPNHFKKRQE